MIPEAPVGGAHLGISAVDPLGLGSLPAFPASANWPTYDHGVGRLGANPNETILGSVNAANLHLEWASNTTGPIESSLAIANGVVYTGAWDARGVYAFDAGTGAFLWNVSAGGGWRPGAPAIAGHGVCTQGFSSDYQTAWTGITSTPAITDGVLFVGGGNNTLFAFQLDPTSPANPPKLLWAADLANFSSGAWQEHYLWGSPLVYRGNVYIGEASACEGPMDGQLFQVNTTSGKVAHVFTAVPAHTWGATIWSTPTLDRASNTIYVTTGNEYEDNAVNGSCANSPDPPNARAIVALNASDITRELGHLQVGTVCTDDDFGAGVTLFRATNGTPMLVAPNKDGAAYALYRSSFHDNLSIPSAAWTAQTFQYDKSPAAFGGGLLYLGGYDSISGIDPNSGSPAWTTYTTNYADGFVEAGVTYANGLVIAGVDWSNFTGSTLLVLNASSGALLYSYAIPGMMINGEPIVSDGRIFVGVGPTSLSGTGQLLSFGAQNLASSPTFGGVASRTSVGPDEISLDVIVLPNLSGGMPGYTCRVDWGDGATSNDCSFDEHAYDIPTFSAGPHYLNGSIAVLDFAGTTSSFRFTIVASPNGSVNWSATPAHLVTFAETGLPAGTTWSVTMTGVTGTSTTPEIAFVLANGSYNYSVHPISGYFVDPTGSVTLATGDAILVIRFTPPPTVALSPTSGPVGTSVTVSGSWFALSASVNLSWGQIPIACASGTANTTSNGGFSCTIVVPIDVEGGHNIIATDRDSGTASAVFTIHSALRTSPTRADEGQAVTVQGTGFSASSTWSVGWSSPLPFTCSGPSHLTTGGGGLRCVFVVPVGASGPYTVSASDSAYPKPNIASTTVTITQDPTISPPVANRSSVDVGQPIRFSAVAALGSGGFTFRWTGLPSGCASTEASFACTPNGAGTFAIVATARDSNGFSVGSSPLNFTVYSDPTTSAPLATPASIDLGQSVWISTLASYGSGAYTFAWSGLPPGCSGAGAAFGCTPLGTGAYIVGVVVTDGNGFPVSSDALTLSISPDPTASPLTASSPSIDVGQLVVFSTSARLGSGDYAFDWSGLPSGCGDSTPSVTCADFPSAGSYRVSVHITDTNGFAIDSSTLGFTVYEDPFVLAAVASAPSADVGQSVSLSAGATGGS
ncbi:MAG: PQQ-binding-like beta-propeller repeat protein, partial [Thermoplasmata archaeon]|nr:PQQ-binding-like beta-propeller repeat protein [Thermoplasmata archaeon]